MANGKNPQPDIPVVRAFVNISLDAVYVYARTLLKFLAIFEHTLYNRQVWQVATGQT